MRQSHISFSWCAKFIAIVKRRCKVRKKHKPCKNAKQNKESELQNFIFKNTHISLILIRQPKAFDSRPPLTFSLCFNHSRQMVFSRFVDTNLMISISSSPNSFLSVPCCMIRKTQKSALVVASPVRFPQHSNSTYKFPVRDAMKSVLTANQTQNCHWFSLYIYLKISLYSVSESSCFKL